MPDPRDLLVSEDGFDRAVWAEISALGWCAIAIPERFGGGGLSLAEVATVTEPMGRHLLATPFVDTQLFVQGLLASAGAAAQAAALPCVAQGALVSLLNGCQYCVDHHFGGLRRLLADDARADAIRTALEQRAFAETFTAREQAGLRYAITLTRNAGFDDGAILEINEVVPYVAYANRTVLGLGVTTDGDVLGLSPGNAQDPGDWSHR